MVSEYLMGDLECPSASSSTRGLCRAKSLEDVRCTEASALVARLRSERAVPLLLQTAKAWSRHARELATYVHKRTQLQAEMAQGMAQLAHSTRANMLHATTLPFQEVYSAALDYDIENSASVQSTCCLLQKEFVQVLTDRRLEHERCRKQMKARWSREMARALSTAAACVSHGQEASESEASVSESCRQLQRAKAELLAQGRRLLLDSDRALKAATVAYFAAQHSLSQPPPTQFQELSERSCSYEPGSLYQRQSPARDDPFLLQLLYAPHSLIEGERKSTGSVESEDLYQDSAPFEQSKAALTHSFRSLRTPGRCRECDSYVYFMGAECIECGMVCHKKCVGGLSIACGHRRLPRKVPVFGTDLNRYLSETAYLIPFIICKCIDEIDARGLHCKGIYRVSGLKTKMDKLCNAFEIGGDLVDLSDIHPNVIADVLKIYLRQLPEPLLTFKLYPDFVRLAKDFASDDGLDLARCAQGLRDLVARLPRAHYLSLAALLLHLKRVADEADSNNMPASNLGIVFGPTLLRPDESLPSISSLVDTAQNSRAVELLIRLSDQLFCADEVQEARAQQQKVRERLVQQKAPAIRGGSFRLPGSSRSARAPKGTEISHYDFPYFMDMDLPTVSQIHRSDSTPKIFKGSLKDYQGLEGLLEERSQKLETRTSTQRSFATSSEERSAQLHKQIRVSLSYSEQQRSFRLGRASSCRHAAPDVRDSSSGSDDSRPFP